MHKVRTFSPLKALFQSLDNLDSIVWQHEWQWKYHNRHFPKTENCQTPIPSASGWVDFWNWACEPGTSGRRRSRRLLLPWPRTLWPLGSPRMGRRFRCWPPIGCPPPERLSRELFPRPRLPMDTERRYHTLVSLYNYTNHCWVWVKAVVVRLLRMSVVALHANSRLSRIHWNGRGSAHSA